MELASSLLGLFSEDRMLNVRDCTMTGFLSYILIEVSGMVVENKQKDKQTKNPENNPRKTLLGRSSISTQYKESQCR